MHGEEAFVITNDGQFDKLHGHLPAGVGVLERRKRLLQGGNVLLLGRKQEAATAVRRTADADSSRR
jgi:hypothetical protein